MAEMRELTSRNTLNTTSTRETTDSGLGYALDVVAEDFAVAFGAAFAETFASFSAWRGKVLVFVSRLVFLGGEGTR